MGGATGRGTARDMDGVSGLMSTDIEHHQRQQIK